jgi:deoxyguanosine kinase
MHRGGGGVAKAVFLSKSAGVESILAPLPLSRLTYVAVEGCIGVGKTTLTRLLSQALHARTVLEVVEENPFLPDFYRDQVAHAFKTQMFFLLSRFKQQEQLAQADLFQHVVVSDYMFDKDVIFAELTLNPSELALYRQVFDALSLRVRSPDVVIYLHAPMPVILERIARRGRSFERDIDRGYLESLVDGYDRFFRNYTASPVLFVDTERLNFPTHESDLDLLLSALQQFPSGPSGRMSLEGQQRQQALL